MEDGFLWFLEESHKLAGRMLGTRPGSFIVCEVPVFKAPSLVMIKDT